MITTMTLLNMKRRGILLPLLSTGINVGKRGVLNPSKDYSMELPVEYNGNRTFVPLTYYFQILY